MIDMIEANWLVFTAAAFAVLLLVGWWLLRRASNGTRRREYKPDVLDEGVGPAQRNQALIDAMPAAAEMDAMPNPEPKAVAAAVAAPDDLGRIKGIGPKLQSLLPTLGISTFAQIAALTEADLADLDSKLGPFAGRPARDGWVEQAKHLAAGDVAGFEARFGKV